MHVIPLVLQPVPGLGTRRPKLFGLEILGTNPDALRTRSAIVSAIIDTGASRSTIPRRLLDPSKLPSLNDEFIQLADGTRKKVQIITTTLYLPAAQRRITLPDLSLTDSIHMLLGCDFLREIKAQLLLDPAEDFDQLLLTEHA